ncbi:MAG: glycosyltransferase [Geitlerinemataceae cyanobacterium]
MSDLQILIYRDRLLPYSETFIPAQAQNYRTYKSIYVGSSLLPEMSLDFRRDRCVTLDRTVSLAAIWKAIFKLTGYPHPAWIGQLRGCHPGLIHAHFGLDGVLAMPLARRLKIPLVVTFHGYAATLEPDADFKERDPFPWRHYFRNRGKFFRHFYLRRRSQLFETSPYMVAVSEHIRQKVIAQGCPPEKIHVHYIGVNVQKFQSQGATAREETVLFVGRLVEKKGCEYLIEAVADLQQTFPKMKLVVVGDGPLRSRLKGLAAQKLARYEFVGKQPQEVVREWMGRAKVLAVPSVTTAQGETEGLPIVLLEGMAMGLPVVVSRHAGMPEAVVHDRNGLLVEERDVRGLSESIARVLSDSNVWEQFSRAGRSQVEAKFDLRANTAMLERAYGEIVAQA